MTTYISGARGTKKNENPPPPKTFMNEIEIEIDTED